MKKNILLLFLLTASLSQAMNKESPNAVSSIDGAIRGFFEPLKESSENLDKAFSTIPNVNSESRRFSEEMAGIKPKKDMRDELTLYMISQKQGRITEYKQVSEESSLNGYYITRSYEASFQGGGKKKFRFVFIKPTTTGPYHLVEREIE